MMNSVDPMLTTSRDEMAFPLAGQGALAYPEAVSFQGDRARRYRRRARAATILAAGFFALSLMEAYALISTVPLIRAVPVFVTLNSDGSFDTHVTFSSLPPDKRVAAIEASLWQYIRQREGYTFATAANDYDIVSAMSAPVVRDTYQNWKLSKDPTNPAVSLGRNGWVSVSRVDGAFVQHNEDYTSGVYRVVFKRRVTAEQMKHPTEQRMIVSVAYMISDSIPAYQRVNYNPDGVVVTEYPMPTQDGAPVSVGE